VSILDLFAKSPFKPLQEHMNTVLECARQLTPLLEALAEGDQAGVASAEREIDRIEGEADRLKNDLRAHLPSRLLLPVDRRDLLEILDLQDSIADCVQDVAELLVEREMPVPDSMRPALLELAVAVVDACEKAAELINSLGDLVEIGFRGREVDRVGHLIDQLGSLEGQADRLEKALTREVFRLESSESSVTVMLWYQMVGWIGNVADYAEKVGNRLRLLIAR
jgi:predicted phosphate transport protein (TIGR00153 family)